MNQEKKLLLIIILSVLAILTAVHLTSCSSTKKAVKEFAQVIKKDESKSSDSVVTKSKDSTSTKQSTNKTVTTDSSGYEKETEETIIEWIVMDDTTKPGKKKENTKMKVTKKVTKEKGRKNTNVISEQSKADSTSLNQHDSAAITKDSSGSMLSDTKQSSKDKQVKKAFPGWAWMVGILVVLSGVGWFFREKLYLLFPFLKRKNDTKG